MSDQRRLKCNSTIMGLHRWWSELFFYNLDVAACNPMVLHKEATNHDKMNIILFKRALVDILASRI